MLDHFARQEYMRRSWVIEHTEAMPEELRRYYRRHAWANLHKARKGRARKGKVSRGRLC